MGQPARIYALEVTNFCNADCTWCPRSQMKRKLGLVQPSTIRKVVDHCIAVNQDYIALHHMGEPLLHPRLNEIISLFEVNGVHTELSTNGALLALHGKKLLQAGLTRLRIAVDFQYSKKFFKTFIKEFLAVSKEFKTEIRLHTLMGNDLSMFEGFGDHVILENKFFDNWAGAIDGVSALPDSKECYFKKYNYVVVLWDGRAVPCCMDFDGRDVLGTVEDLSSIVENNCCRLCKDCAKMQFADGGGWQI